MASENSVLARRHNGSLHNNSYPIVQTFAPAPSAMATVSSVLPESTTQISSVRSRTLASVAGSESLELKVRMTTEGRNESPRRRMNAPLYDTKPVVGR